VDIEVSEGRFVEVPTADATGMDRRAFGEFVSPRGELASYAFGWTTGSEDHVAKLTIGIGAGNPGGGTFHAVVFEHEGECSFSLIDEPFEDVPEGGPDLSADEARAHDTLPFVWWVADEVMDRDRRAWWMRHWVLGTYCVQSAEVFEQREPVLLVVNDAADDMWQLLGATGVGDDAKIGHLHHAIDEDPTLVDVLDLSPGESAIRAHLGAPWDRRAAAPTSRPPVLRRALRRLRSRRR
jgi:hypothetical protein